MQFDVKREAVYCYSQRSVCVLIVTPVVMLLWHHCTTSLSPSSLPPDSVKLVMEFLDGGTLSEATKAHVFNERHIAYIAREVSLILLFFFFFLHAYVYAYGCVY
jgi:serine/threonine protein kinase